MSGQLPGGQTIQNKEVPGQKLKHAKLEWEKIIIKKLKNKASSNLMVKVHLNTALLHHLSSFAPL